MNSHRRNTFDIPKIEDKSITIFDSMIFFGFIFFCGSSISVGDICKALREYVEKILIK